MIALLTVASLVRNAEADARKVEKKRRTKNLMKEMGYSAVYVELLLAMVIWHAGDFFLEVIIDRPIQSIKVKCLIYAIILIVASLVFLQNQESASSEITKKGM